MASDGLINKAKTGTCRMCLRARNTEMHLKAVGEVRHGYATGHIWECRDIEDCERVCELKLGDLNLSRLKRSRLEVAKQRGRFTEYLVYS